MGVSFSAHPYKGENVSEKKKVVFITKTVNLNIVKKKGATIVTAVPGGTKSEVTPTSWIRFRDHKCVVDDLEEIEIIRQHIKDYPRDGIVELIPKTPQDVLEEKATRAALALKEYEEAKEAIKAIEKSPVAEEVVKVSPEVTLYEEKCADCDWVAQSSVSQKQAQAKLRGHRMKKHRIGK